MRFLTWRVQVPLVIALAISLFANRSQAGLPDQGVSDQKGTKIETAPTTGSGSAAVPTGAASQPNTTAGSIQSSTSSLQTTTRLPWEGATELVAGKSTAEAMQGPPKDDRPPPSAEEVAALRELEGEVERFTKMGGAYQQSVNAILRRSYLWQRREMEKDYASKIDEEEKLQQKARLKAIELFEKFIAKYPQLLQIQLVQPGKGGKNARGSFLRTFMAL